MTAEDFRPSTLPPLERVAVIGYGSIGRRHCENLIRLGVPEVVVVRREQGVNAAFTPPATCHLVQSHREALAAGVGLAVICNPTSLHVETARVYLAAGVPVLIEKPMSVDLTTADELERFVLEQGRWAGMAYCLRHHPAYRLARAALHQGRIGRILYAKAWFEGYLPDWHPWEDYRTGYAARPELGGGVLPTLDHELDFLNWCLGVPRSVAGKTWNSGTLGIEVDDSAWLSLQFGEGERAMVTLSFCRRDPARGFEFIGDRGTLRFSWQQPRLELIGDATETLWDGANYDVNAMYVELLQANLAALAAGEPTTIPLAAGVESLRVCEALR